MCASSKEPFTATQPRQSVREKATPNYTKETVIDEAPKPLQKTKKPGGGVASAKGGVIAIA
jgi:hypothetical protein